MQNKRAGEEKERDIKVWKDHHHWHSSGHYQYIHRHGGASTTMPEHITQTCLCHSRSRITIPFATYLQEQGRHHLLITFLVKQCLHQHPVLPSTLHKTSMSTKGRCWSTRGHACYTFLHVTVLNIQRRNVHCSPMACSVDFEVG